MHLCLVTSDRYRKFGHPQQFPVYSEDEIAELCSLHDGYRSCYISSCEFSYERDEEIAYPLFLLLDFDAGNGYTKQDALHELVRSIRYAELHGWRYMANSTGCKGYHLILEVAYSRDIYSSFNYRVIDVQFRRAYKAFHELITHELNLKTLDPHVKDFTRLIRIPGTMNPKCDVRCVTVMDHDGISVPILDYAPPIDTLSNVSDAEFVPSSFEFPCLEHHIRDVNPTHEQRVLYVKMRVQQGVSAQTIYDELKAIGKGRWRDWDPDITRYMVAYYAELEVNVRCHPRFCTDECYLRRWKHEEHNGDIC